MRYAMTTTTTAQRDARFLINELPCSSCSDERRALLRIKNTVCVYCGVIQVFICLSMFCARDSLLPATTRIRQSEVMFMCVLCVVFLGVFFRLAFLRVLARRPDCVRF